MSRPQSQAVFHKLVPDGFVSASLLRVLFMARVSSQCAARTRRIVTGDPRFHEAASFYLTPTCGMLAKYFTERMYGAVPADWSASRGLSLTWPCA